MAVFGKCSPCVPALEEDYCADRRDATRSHEACCSNTMFPREEMQRPSHHDAQLRSYLTLIFQSSSRVCLMAAGAVEAGL